MAVQATDDMHFLPDEQVYGIPVRKVHKFVVAKFFDGQASFSLSEMVLELGCSPSDAVKIGAWLSDIRAVIPYEHEFILDPDGGAQFVLAKIREPIPRPKAKVLLASAVEIAKRSICEDAWAWKVLVFRVYGSYLKSGTSKLGDIDVALTLSPRVRKKGLDPVVAICDLSPFFHVTVVDPQVPFSYRSKILFDSHVDLTADFV